MKVYAHRGASAEQPENTLAAFRRAVELGVAGVELDIHLSADGQPVVIHDETVDRTTNRKGPVNMFTVAELADMDAGNGEHVPTLAEVLDIVCGKVHVNIEIKSADAADAMLETVVAYGNLVWCTSSFVWPALEHVGRVAPGTDIWPLSYGSQRAMTQTADDLDAHPELPYAQRYAATLRSSGNTMERAVELATRLGGSAVSISDRGLSADDVRALHDAGLKAWVWTVNDPARARELLASGVDSICTDDPAAMLAVTASARAS